jgi:hypothetical protein
LSQCQFDALVSFVYNRGPKYSREMLTTDDEANTFFLMNKSFYDELHIHSPVTIIDTSCSMIIVGSRGETFIEWAGHVYAAKKMKLAKATADVPPDTK